VRSERSFHPLTRLKLCRACCRAFIQYGCVVGSAACESESITVQVCRNLQSLTTRYRSRSGEGVMLCRNDGCLAQWRETWSPFSTPRDVLVSCFSHHLCLMAPHEKCMNEWSGSQPTLGRRSPFLSTQTARDKLSPRLVPPAARYLVLSESALFSFVLIFFCLTGVGSF